MRKPDTMEGRRNGFGAEVETGEPHAHFMQHALVLQILTRLSNLQPSEDVASVWTKTTDIGHQCVQRIVHAKIIKAEAGHVVKRLARECAVGFILQPTPRSTFLATSPWFCLSKNVQSFRADSPLCPINSVSSSLVCMTARIDSGMCSRKMMSCDLPSRR